MANLSGNTTIGISEIEILRKGILERFEFLQGECLEEKTLNSNLNNYSKLQDNINKQLSVFEQRFGSLKTASALAVLFHFSKKSNQQFETFRTKVVNMFYMYAFNMDRDAYYLARSKDDTESIHDVSLDYFTGYWQIYSDKRGDFAKLIKANKPAELYKVHLYIRKDGHVYYRAHNYHGRGNAFSNDTTLTLDLLSDIDHKPLYFYLHIGQPVAMMKNHPKYFAGIYLNIDKHNNIQAGRIAMIYMDEQKTEGELQYDESILNDTILGYKAEEILRLNSDEEMLYEFFMMENDSNLSNNRTIVSVSDFDSL